VLEKSLVPQIVNDGVTIAKEIELEDHVGKPVSHSSSSLQTNDAAGDGTTTASERMRW